MSNQYHVFLAPYAISHYYFVISSKKKWVDDGSPVDVVYLDFQKAFNKVPHQRLFLKLKSHSIVNDVINWIEKWLTHRRQRVEYHRDQY